MARICEATGKKTMFGGSRQHNRGKAGGTKGPWAYKSQRTTRKWDLNLRKARVRIDGVVRSVRLSMKSYKRLRKDGKIWLSTKGKFGFFVGYRG